MKAELPLTIVVGYAIDQTRCGAMRIVAKDDDGSITVAGARWDHLIGGRGIETMLIFPGLIGIAEISFPLILRLESEYQVIAPSYPSMATTIHQL